MWVISIEDHNVPGAVSRLARFEVWRVSDCKAKGE